jgi:hypothetical protein
LPIKKFLMPRWLLLSSLLTCGSIAVAEPFINTSDIYLRANLSILANQGYLHNPITTYPLMWNDIAKDLAAIDVYHLTAAEQQAYAYVKHQLTLAERKQSTISLDVAVHNTRFTSFGEPVREKNNLKLQSSWLSEQFAGKLATQYSSAPVDDGHTTLDGSYLAGFLGNWVLSVGRQDRWFGPTWDSSLSLSNNAHPMPAIALSRKSAQPFIIPFTEYPIPWTVTTFMAKMDDHRVVADALLWGFRLNFKPFASLELGITRLAQWAGTGRPSDTSTFWKVLTGNDNCGLNGLTCNADNPEPGNQQAGFDLRYNLRAVGVPLVLYGQYFAEDGNNKSFSFVTEPQIQFGIETQFSLFSTFHTLFVEYSDTYADCKDTDQSRIGDCYYEHHIYQTGMRYQQRTLGNLYDNDARSVVLGLFSTVTENTHLSTKLRWLQLNQDDHDKAPLSPIIGNPLTKVAENVLMLSLSARHSYKNWRFTLAADVSQSSFQATLSDQQAINLAAQIEHNF